MSVIQNLTVKVNNKDGEVGQYSSKNGRTLVINSLEDVNYVLINEDTGYAPDDLTATRIGNDLIIEFEGVYPPKLIIKNYYTTNGSTSNLVVGQHEDGQYYPFVPESGQREHALGLLAQHVKQPQALGGDAIEPFFNFNPYWLLALLPLVGLAAAGGGGGGGGDGGTAPVAGTVPNLDAKLDDSSDSGKKGDNITNDTTPIIDVTTKPNADIVIKDKDGKVIGQGTADDNGKAKVEITTGSELTEGDNTIKVIVTDSDKNTNTKDLEIKIDTTKPVIENPHLDPDSNSGSKNDNITNDTTPTITGKTEPNSDVVLKDKDGKVIGTGKSDGDGNFKVTVDDAKELADGAQTIQVEATDTAGNVSDPKTVDLVIDSTKPNPPTAQLDPASDSGVKGDNITNITTPKIVGTAEPNSTVTLYDKNNKVIGAATADANGAYSIDIPADKKLDGGLNNLKVDATDSAGNTSDKTPLDITINLDELSVTAYLDPSDDSGVKGDGITSIKKPHISGKVSPAEENSNVKILDSSDNVIGTGVTDANGNFNILLTTELAENKNNLKVKVTNTAGNVAENGFIVDVDTTAPNITIELDPASDSGTKGDNITNSKNLVFIGKTEPSIEVELFDKQGNSLGKTTSGVDGNYSISVPSSVQLTENGNDFSVKATDNAGNKSDPANITIKLDTTSPDSITLKLDPASDSGEVGDNKTNVAKPTLIGDTEPNATVKIFENGKVIAETTADGNGHYSVTLTKDLTDGTHTLTAKGYDVAGNEVVSDPLNLEIDLKVPGDTNGDGEPNAAPVVTIPENDNGGVNAEEVKDGIQTNVTMLKGTEVGDKVILTVTPKDGSTPFEVVSDPITANDLASGKKEVTIPVANLKDANGFKDGDYEVKAIIKDAAGNQSLESQPVDFHLDTGVPGDKDGDGDSGGANDVAPQISIPENADGGINAAEAQDGVQVEVLLPIKTQAGDFIKLTILDSSGKPVNLANDYEIQASDISAQTTPDMVGKATVTIPKALLKDGDYTVVAKVYDSVGNESKDSNSADFHLDTGVPGDVNNDGASDKAPIIDIPETMAEDGQKAGTVNAKEASDGVQVDVQIPANSKVGDTIILTVTKPDGNTAEITHVIDASDLANNQGLSPDMIGKTTISIPVSDLKTGADFNDGAYKVTAKVVDPVGNESKASAPADFTLDTTTPGIDSDGDGVGDQYKPIVTIPENDSDGFVSETEASDGVIVWVDVPKGTQEGDTVHLTVTKPNSSETFSYDNTKVVLANLEASTNPNMLGKVQITIPKEDLRDGNNSYVEGNYKVVAKITDDAGNSSQDSDFANLNLQINHVDGAPTISIPEAADGVSVAELADGVQVKVTLPNGVQAGDTLIFNLKDPDGTPKQIEHVLTAEDIAANTNGTLEITIAKTDVTKDGLYEVDALVKSQNTQTNSPVSNKVKFDVDITVPGDTDGDGVSDTAPTISVPENADGGVNADEAQDGVVVKVSIPKGTEEGDTITLTVTPPNGGTPLEIKHVITATELTNKSADITIPATDLKQNSAYKDGDYDLKAVITDPSGNQSKQGTGEFLLDTTAPTAPTAELPEDATNDTGKSLSDNVTNNNTPTLQGTGEDGSTISVKINGETYTATVSNGKWEVQITNPIPDGIYKEGSGEAGTNTISVIAADQAGNKAAASSVETITIDTAPPAVPTAELPEDPTNDTGDDPTDNYTNNQTPTIKGTGEVGSVITMQLGGKTYENIEVKTDGTWEVKVAEPLAKGTYTPILTATDLAGNTSQGNGETFSVDIVNPVIDTASTFNFSYDENQVADPTQSDGSSNILGTIQASDEFLAASDGEVVSYKIVEGNEDGSYVLDKDGNIRLTANGLTSKANNFELTPEGAPRDEADKFTDASTDAVSQKSIKVVAVDKAGNESAAATINLEIKDVYAKIVSVKVEDNDPENPAGVANAPADLHENIKGNEGDMGYMGEVKPLTEANDLATGLTNDTTQKLTVTLDKALDDNQEIVLVVEQINKEVDETGATVTTYTKLENTNPDYINKALTEVSADGKTVTLVTDLDDNKGADLRYTAKVVSTNRVDSNVETSLRLDSVAEDIIFSRAYEESQGGQTRYKLIGKVEAGATLSYMKNGVLTNIDVDDQGVFTLDVSDLQGINHDENVINLVSTAEDTAAQTAFRVVDKAGNINQLGNVNIWRYNSYDVNDHPVDPNGNEIIAQNRKNFAGIETMPRYYTHRYTDANDIILVDNYISRASGPADDFVIDTGKGNDYILVNTGVLGAQALERPFISITMGEGNDSFDAEFDLGGKTILDMGEGDDRVDIKGNVYGSSTIKLGSGNNYVNVGANVNGSSKIIAGDEDDVVIIKNDLVQSEVNLGAGKNAIRIGHDIINGKVITGNDNDYLYVGANVDGNNTKIDLGSGQNTIEIKGNYLDGSITTGDDDDTLIVNGYLANTLDLNLGGGNNKVIVRSSVLGFGQGDVTLGNGNDTLEFTKGIFGNFAYHLGAGDDVINAPIVGAPALSGPVGVRIYGEAGNDTINAETIRNSTIELGEGEDKIIADKISNSTISLGVGNDSVTANIFISGTKINLDQGDDTFIFNGTGDGNVSSGSVVNGGGGNDTAIITGQANTGIFDQKAVTIISSQNLKGFENVILKGQAVYDIRYNDIESDGDRIGGIYITKQDEDTTGGKGVSVDLGATNYNSDAFDPGKVNLSDNGKTWEKVGQVEKDGITYDQYHYNIDINNGTNNDIYIQQGIYVF